MLRILTAKFKHNLSLCLLTAETLVHKAEDSHTVPFTAGFCCLFSSIFGPFKPLAYYVLHVSAYTGNKIFFTVLFGITVIFKLFQGFKSYECILAYSH